VQSLSSWILIELIAKPLGLRTFTTEAREREGGRTNGDDYCSEAIGGPSRLDGMEIRKVEHLCELCASAVSNRGWISKPGTVAGIEDTSREMLLSKMPGDDL